MQDKSSEKRKKLKKSSKKEGRKGSPFYWILQSLLLVVILLGLLFLYGGLSLPGWKVREQHILEEKVQSLQELVTVNQIFRDVIYKEQRRILADKRVLFSIHFHIKAGINMSNATVHWNHQGDPVVTIAAPEILSIDADEQSINQIFIKEQLAEIRQSDYMEVILQEKLRLEQEALERGILSEAEDQARRIIKQIFRLAGYDRVEIFVEQSL